MDCIKLQNQLIEATCNDLLRVIPKRDLSYQDRVAVLKRISADALHEADTIIMCSELSSTIIDTMKARNATLQAIAKLSLVTVYLYTLTKPEN